MGPHEYDKDDFGAKGVNSQENWRDSGYDHHTAYADGIQISWNEAEYTDSNGVDHHDVVDIHVSKH